MTKAVPEQKREITERAPRRRASATDGHRAADAPEHMTRVEDMQSVCPTRRQPQRTVAYVR